MWISWRFLLVTHFMEIQDSFPGMHSMMIFAGFPSVDFMEILAGFPSVHFMEIVAGFPSVRLWLVSLVCILWLSLIHI